MSGYIHAIRPVERTIVYSRIQALSPYAAYPYRDGEPQLPPDSEHDWNHIFRRAAVGAAEWVQTAKHSQYLIDQIKRDLGRLAYYADGSLKQSTVEQSIHTLTEVLNDLESTFKQYSGELKPELWQRVEKALQHPGSAAVGLKRSQENGLWVAAAPLGRVEEQLVKRLLLGADGLLNQVKYALTIADQQKAADLLQFDYPLTLPYTAYYGSMQSYWPLPTSGLILNQYL